MRQKLTQLGTKMEYSANTVKSMELPRVNISKKWQLRLKATIETAGITSPETYGTKVANSPATLLKRIEVRVTSAVAGGRSQTIKVLSAEDIYLMNQYLRKGLQENIDNAPTGTTNAPGTTDLYGSYDIDWSIPELVDLAVAVGKVYRPQQVTLFDPRVYNPVEIVVTWGDETSLRSGATSGKFTISSAELMIYSVDLPEEMVAGGLKTNRQHFKEQVISGATSDLRVDLPKGNFIRQIFVQAYNDGVLDNSIVNSLKVVVNEDLVEYDIGFNALRNENAKFYNIPFSSLLTGCALIDFDEKRDLQGLLDVRAVDSVRLSFDVNKPTGDSKIRLIVQEIVS